MRFFFPKILFLYVLLALVAAPLVFQFFSEPQSEIAAHYPFSVFFNGFTAVFIYILATKGWIFKKAIQSGKKPFFVYASTALITFGVLCLSSVFFELLSFFGNFSSGIQRIAFPSGLFGFLNFISGVVFASFFEEVIYRFYLPEALKDFSINPKLSVLCETITVILFAAGHIYLGLFGFLNALVSGAALRFCVKKTCSVFPAFIVHAIYNFLTFLCFYFIQRN